jgi:archaellum component FlaC
VSDALSLFGPLAAVAGAAVALVIWFLGDRRKSKAETTVAEATVQSEIDKADLDARDARLLYVQRQVDLERSFHQQQIADRDAEIERQRTELGGRDARIAALLAQVEELQTQVERVTGLLNDVRSQLTELATATNEGT